MTINAAVLVWLFASSEIWLCAQRKIGFRPFGVGSAGVYGSEEWRQKTATPQETADRWRRVEQQNGGIKTTDASM